MSMTSRVKSLLGGSGRSDTSKTLTAAATLTVPGWSNLFYLSGTDTVTALVAEKSTRDREVTFIGLSGTTTFTNTNNPTTVNQMDLGGSNRAVAATDVLVLILKQDGTWVMKSFTDN